MGEEDGEEEERNGESEGSCAWSTTGCGCNAMRAGYVWGGGEMHSVVCGVSKASNVRDELQMANAVLEGLMAPII
ncbi:unnamed protein product [Sphagnum balticum]